MLDKLVLNFGDSRRKLDMNRVSRTNHRVVRDIFNDGTPILQFISDHHTIVFRNRYMHWADKIFINPTEFRTYEEMHETLSLLIPSARVRSYLQVQRIDHCVDMFNSPQYVLKAIRLPYKQYLGSHFQAGAFTGVTAGKGDEVINVYPSFIYPYI